MVSGRPGVASRQAAVVDRPWSVATQVHSADVLTVRWPGDGAGERADGLVTAHPGAAIAVLTADCAPLALASPEGIAGVAHAGWRGLLAGVIEATVDAMRDLGATEVEAVLGPCIRPECYTFGSKDLATVAERLGPAVRSKDRDGGLALDIPAAVSAALAGRGARLAADAGVCTSCGDGYWSWRARGDGGRQATVARCG
jgi:YfiH family protein